MTVDRYIDAATRANTRRSYRSASITRPNGVTFAPPPQGPFCAWRTLRI